MKENNILVVATSSKDFSHQKNPIATQDLKSAILPYIPFLRIHWIRIPDILITLHRFGLTGSEVKHMTCR